MNKGWTKDQKNNMKKERKDQRLAGYLVNRDLLLVMTSASAIHREDHRDLRNEIGATRKAERRLTQAFDR